VNDFETVRKALDQGHREGAYAALDRIEAEVERLLEDIANREAHHDQHHAEDERLRGLLKAALEKPMRDAVVIERLRAALGLAERFISTDWEPDDYDRDLIQPVRAALAKEEA